MEEPVQKPPQRSWLSAFTRQLLFVSIVSGAGLFFAAYHQWPEAITLFRALVWASCVMAVGIVVGVFVVRRRR